MKHSLDAAAISPTRGGTTPYYVMELMMQRHAYAAIFLWVVLFGGLSALLVRSDDLQYDCFSFCDTGVVQSCSGILHTANSTDVSWRSSPSHCLQAPINASAIPFLWSSQGPFSSSAGAAASSLLTLDAIPDMSSTGRRIGRFVLRFDLSEYTTGSVSSGSPMNPKVRCVKVLNVSTDEHSGAVTTTVLPTPLILGTMSFDNILVDVLVPGGSAAIVLELPIGYRFPEGTQQLVIEFPGGPPLVPLVGNATVNTSSVQLTFATSSPTYLMYEVLARYVLLGTTCVLVLLVLCLHALADTTVYEVFHPSVPTFAGWLACFSAVSCVTENESLLRAYQPLQVG
ncbi:membrane-associated protein, putative [Bodo saltans]|uniref:Membrane-associated protein, putative n=1 Tax=Bodo saltans TaxID=75058 RepID=A0A0S4JMN4_BODSA|nr:membrane-associated protein, putative [Bodo saltans]|eukprot:CUG92754.1 membrane-associated protein, putative [Bodo saltans]